MTAPTRRRRLVARPLVVALLSPMLVLAAGSGTAASAGPLDGLGDLGGLDGLLGDGGPCLPLSGVDDCDTSAPETTITGSSPMPVDGVYTRKTMTFAFAGSDDREDAALTFECRLVTPQTADPAWASCDPAEGAQYDVDDAPLEAYRFEVRASDDAVTFPGEAAPNTDQTPAMQSFGVDTTAPETRRFSGPSRYEASRTAEFVHGSSDAGAGYACTLDGASIGCDEDYLKVTGLSSGRHRLTVASVDAYGNADPSPVVTRWFVPRNQLGTQTERQRWRRQADSAAFDGDLLQTKRRGAELTQKLRGVRGVGLIVAKGADRGRLRVKFNRISLAVIDLDDARGGSETVVMDLPGRKKRSGTLRVIPLDRQPVAVDGYFTS